MERPSWCWQTTLEPRAAIFRYAGWQHCAVLVPPRKLALQVNNFVCIRRSGIGGTAQEWGCSGVQAIRCYIALLSSKAEVPMVEARSHLALAKLLLEHTTDIQDARQHLVRAVRVVDTSLHIPFASACMRCMHATAVLPCLAWDLCMFDET